MKNRTKKRRIYALYGRRDSSLTAQRKTFYKLEDLLAEIPAGLPIDEAWDQISPVGREFGSRDYERLTELDAWSGKIDQALFSKMPKRERR